MKNERYENPLLKRADTGNTNAVGGWIRGILFLGAVSAAVGFGASVLNRGGQTNHQAPAVEGPAVPGGN